jgi:hypothetical protein
MSPQPYQGGPGPSRGDEAQAPQGTNGGPHLHGAPHGVHGHGYAPYGPPPWAAYSPPWHAAYFFRMLIPTDRMAPASPGDRRHGDRREPDRTQTQGRPRAVCSTTGS